MHIKWELGKVSGSSFVDMSRVLAPACPGTTYKRGDIPFRTEAKRRPRTCTFIRIVNLSTFAKRLGETSEAKIQVKDAVKSSRDTQRFLLLSSCPMRAL